MSHGETAGLELREQRLDVAQRRFAGRRVPHVTDRSLPGQAVDRGGRGEMIADQALAAFGVEPNAIEGDDAGRLLPSMLERMQTERHDRCRVRMTEDAEDAAFLAQPVSVQIDA